MTTATQTIPKGYKQTEIGLIPEDWSIKPMHEVGKTYGGLSGKVKADFGSGNSRYIPFMNIMSNPIIDITYFDIVNIKTNEIQAKAQKNDLFFNGSSETPEEVGMCSVLLKEIPNLYLNSFCFGFRLNKDLKINGLWLSYFFRSGIGRELIYSLAQGATRYNLSKTNFLKLRILYPESEEQTAIATVLSDTDALIEKLEKLIAKKKAVKQGAMQQLLNGKKRLPGFSGEWEVKKLGEVAQIKTGSRNNQDKIEDGAYPLFVRSQTVERINSYSHDCEAILVPGEGNIGNIFHYIDGRFDVHQRVYAITKFEKDISGKFIFLYMLQYFGFHAMQNSVKATVDSLRLPTFQAFEMKLPPTKEEQTAIATNLSNMDAEIEGMEKSLKKYQQIKIGMMQQLLTGKIRL